MLYREKSAVMSLSAIMAFRMLGLFMILPIFSAYAGHLIGATPLLIGIALGIYGLTQACLQLPFGMLSDKIGRKPVILMGLLLFAVGSVIAALSHTITGIIIGRAVQGAGAIGSTCIALVADLTRDENRSKAMAMIGLSIGTAFTIALVLGPIINTWFHLNGIFWATAVLSGLGIVLLFTTIPTPPTLSTHSDTVPIATKLKSLLTHKALLRLDIGILCSHAILTATFIAIPILFTHHLQLTETHQILLYLIVLGVSFIAMVPFIIIAEKKRQMKRIFCGAVMTIGVSQLLLLGFHHNDFSIGATLLLFFTAFTLLEASLPSMVSKIAPIRSKGTATGIYSTSQFLGIFIGGSVGGWLHGLFGLNAIFIFCAVLALVWTVVAMSMKEPPYLSTLVFSLTTTAADSVQALYTTISALPGVGEVALMDDNNLLYIKADKKLIDENELRNLIQPGNLAEQSS